MAAYYNLDQVSLSIAGVPITGGYGEGGSVSIKRNTEIFENVVGRTGEVVRSRTNDKSGTCEVTLLQTSADNAALAALARLDEGTQNGAGVGAFQCRDRENGDIYSSARAWVQKLPDIAFDRKQTDVTWVIFLEEVDFFQGGRP
jgi:hypothetical protein